MTDGSREQVPEGEGAGRPLLYPAARGVGWLIVPLYVVSDVAFYLLTYSLVPCGEP